MATVTLKETTFTFRILPTNSYLPFYARIQIALKNEHLSYEESYTDISVAEVEELVFSAARLLAGGYGREYNLTFERSGISVDLYPSTDEKAPYSREERRACNCMMAIRILLRSQDSGEFLGGIFTLLLSREEIEVFASQLHKEYQENLLQRIHGMGKYAFVGVSPLGYAGCNYLYLDESEGLRVGDYVWVYMGRNNTEQIVCVDNVFRYDEENAPYAPQLVKRVLRKATKQETDTL